MAKKNVKRLGRKALSLLLTLTMVTSMLQISAFAASSAWQIMDGHFIVNENGNQGKAAEGVTSVTEDGFTLTKEISPTNEENHFNITLTVETSETVTTSDAAVQLVIDTSSSMRNNCGDCRYGERHTSSHRNRLEALKDILNDEGGFLDSLATANTGKVYVSVVYFNAGAGTHADWTDIKADGGLDMVKGKIETLPEATGTNIHAGLMLARNRLGMDAVKNAGAKYTVLLSDGEAHHSSNESNSTESISGGGSGNATTKAKNMADAVKQISSLYAVGYGVQKSYLESIVGEGDHVLVGEDSATINAAFANIAQSATEGMSGAGTTVSDPMGQSVEMGQYIILGDVSALEAEGVTKNGNGIAWALDPEKAEKTKIDDNTTRYTYSITYPITLDTSVPGFKEDTYYATNGHTYLSVPQDDGSVKPISFLVPGVKGVIPEYDWTVEYYLQDESSINEEEATYSLDKTDEMGQADLHSTVFAPEGHEDEYKGDGYTFAEGDKSIVITEDESKNIIRLYYDLKVAPVTVKHYYKTTTISPEGVETVGEYEIDPDKTSTEFAVVGKSYEAPEQPKFGGVTFEFDKATNSITNSGKVIHISETRENLIELFYSRIDDQRKPTTAQVDHVYTLSTYELNEDGKYELVEKAPVKEEKVQYSENKLPGQVYPVSAEPIKEGYELNPNQGDYAALAEDDMSFVIKPAAEDNIRTLYFEKTEDKRVETKVTVEHYYTKNITAIEDGEVVNYNDPDGELGLTEEFDIYVGEKFVATESTLYGEDTYNSDESNAGKLVIESVEGGEVIKLYYDLSVAPKQAEVIANHYWRTFTEVTVELTEEVVNEETGETETIVIGTDIEIRETVDEKIEGIKYTDLYEGQKHIEAQKALGEGYTFNAEESIVEVIAGEGVEANLFYDKYTEADERSDADIKVHHNYTTYLTTIVDGEVKTLPIKEGPVEESYPAEGEELKAGDEFVAIAQPVYNENEYTQITAEEDLSVILQPGTNATIVINYEREVSDLVDTDYSVDYEYRTYTMTINEEGVAGYWNAPEVTTDAAGDAGYVGQKVTLDAKEVEGFEPVAGNPATVQILKDGENHWTFVYEKYIPLAEGSVVVNHHYKTITIAVNGTSSEVTQDVPGTPVTKHIGETYTAEAVLNGFEQTGVTVDAAAVELAESVAVTVGEATVIDFFYEKTIDLSVPVTYSIAHEYYLYDWDGSLISESKPAPVTGTGFATNLLVVAPEANDYELSSATYNGADLTDYNIILQDGENVVVFQYEKTLARDFVNAQVIHNYYRDEAAMQVEDAQPEKQYVENAANLPEGSEFSAEQRIDEGYVFHSANPESMEIVVTEDGENVIIVNYIRASASYEVIHIYNRNGSEEGRTSETLGGLDGDIVTAESIARVTGYNGNTYAFVSITEDIVLDSDAEVLPSIILTYNRTVHTPPPGGGGGGGGGRTPDPKPEPVIEIPEEEVPLAPAPVEEPIVEIPDEEVPLANVPMTGDETALYAIMALASGLGLVYLVLSGKKREDEMA